MSGTTEMGQGPEMSPLFRTPGKSNVFTKLYRLNHNSDNGLNQKDTYMAGSGSPMKITATDQSCNMSVQSPCKASTPVPDTTVPDTPSRIEELSSTVSNPFEKFMLSRLHVATFSPSVFSKISTPSSGDKSTKNFRWSIDQMALLHPADIDEKLLEHQTDIHDDELDSHAQKTIDNFFSSQLIAPSPSPWSQSSKPSGVVSTSCSVIMESVHDNSTNAMSARNSSLSTQGSKEVASQTALSFPVNFDLQKILSDFYVTEEGTADSLSTSSLRRKLFSHADCVSAPASPVQMKASCVPHELSPQSHVLKQMHATPQHRRGVAKTAQFSSSPIIASASCRSSPGRDNMSSPELSPIMSRRIKTPAPGGNIGNSPFAYPHTPSCYPLQATPSSGRQSVPFTSPNMSPIGSDSLNQMEKSSRNNHVQSLNFDNVAAHHQPNVLEDNPPSVQVESVHSLLSVTRDVSPKRSSTPTEESLIVSSTYNAGIINFNDNTAPSCHSLHQKMFGGAAQLSAIRENHSIIDIEACLSSVHQDTGYCTNSLQITGLDTKSHSALAASQEALSSQNAICHKPASSAQKPINAQITDQHHQEYLCHTNNTGLQTSLLGEKTQLILDKHDENPYTIASNRCKDMSQYFISGPKLADENFLPVNFETQHMDCWPSKVLTRPRFSSSETELGVSLCDGKTQLCGVGISQSFSWDPIGSSTPSRRHLAELQNVVAKTRSEGENVTECARPMEVVMSQDNENMQY